jgi:hypothetical protein
MSDSLNRYMVNRTGQRRSHRFHRFRKLRNEPTAPRKAGDSAPEWNRFLPNEPILSVLSRPTGEGVARGTRWKITKRTHALGAPVQGSRFKVHSCRNYETKPTGRMWAKRDRPRMESRVTLIAAITKRTHLRRPRAEGPEIRMKSEARIYSTPKHFNLNGLQQFYQTKPTFRGRNCSHLRFSKERSQANATANLPNEAMRSARRFKVPSSRVQCAA